MKRFSKYGLEPVSFLFENKKGIDYPKANVFCLIGKVGYKK